MAAVTRTRYLIGCDWSQAPHLTPEACEKTLQSVPPYLRDARSKGIPQLGAGAIWPISESDVRVPDMVVPSHWVRGFGFDAGGGAKPTAAVWGAWDRDSDTVFITAVYRRAAAEPAIHLAAVLAKGAWIPGVGDCAALILTSADAEQLIKVYRRGGMNIHLADKSVETGLADCWDRLSTGRLKVFASCTQWFEEYRLFRRDDLGRVVKANDHLMDATRYLIHSGLKRMIVKPGKEETSAVRVLGRESEHTWMNS